MPIRIQRKRTKGWKMPPNTVSVTRPGEFGNPFVVGGLYKIGNGKSRGEFSYLRCLYEKYNDGSFIKIESVQQALNMYQEYLNKYPLTDAQIEKLRGKNLACFCKEGEPCHADLLLKIVNQ